MRRVYLTGPSRAECLTWAREFDWLGENSPTFEGAAYAFDRARFFRSLALVAKDNPAPIEPTVQLSGEEPT